MHHVCSLQCLIVKKQGFHGVMVFYVLNIVLAKLSQLLGGCLSSILMDQAKFVSKDLSIDIQKFVTIIFTLFIYVNIKLFLQLYF
jgi:hypothetical protein